MTYAPRHRMLSAIAGTSVAALAVAGLTVGTTAAPSTAHTDPTGADCLQAVGAGPDDLARQRAFAAASQTFGVPQEVLLGVSYMESRWDDHGASPSTTGGYGPMHLTDVSPQSVADARGEEGDSVSGPATSASLRTLDVAARLTKLPADSLTTSDAANICGGAALLASYQRDLDQRTGASTPAASWHDAVEAYGGVAGTDFAEAFAERVFITIRAGAARTTADGQQVSLAARPGVKTPSETAADGSDGGAASHIDCPATLDCEWIEAPYEQYGDTVFEYGNHDLANREKNLTIDYIVIHDTETDYPLAIRLVTDPTYVSWNYTINSANGHVAQHLDAKDVGFHAGNWYMNMHSIGIEHTGYAATGATWYTEAMYQNSAQLVRHLAEKYSVPLDRAHIIGHDQVPGVTPAYVRGMHWDPGPYWNWEHYMELMGAPIKPDRSGKSDVWTVGPGFKDNVQPLTGCTKSGCEPQGTNFVYLHTRPDASSPLVKDAGLRPDGSHSTTHVSDIGARLAAGQKVVVAKRSGDWVGVWYLGEIGWLDTTQHNGSVLVPSGGPTVSVKPGAEAAPVYGRAYPEQAAYAGTPVPYQTVTPLQYTIKAGQEYSVADTTVDTNYYYAKTYDASLPGDHTVVTGKDKYYEVWFGHRLFFVRAADVVLNE